MLTLGRVLGRVVDLLTLKHNKTRYLSPYESLERTFVSYRMIISIILSVVREARLKNFKEKTRTCVNCCVTVIVFVVMNCKLNHEGDYEPRICATLRVN